MKKKTIAGLIVIAAIVLVVMPAEGIEKEKTVIVLTYGAPVALKVEHPGGPGVYLSEWSSIGSSEDDQVLFSHVVHYQWCFEPRPERLPIVVWLYGNLVNCREDIGIYNLAYHAYMVRDGNGVKLVHESELSDLDPFQWRVESIATYPLLERFWLRHVDDKWELRTGWKNLVLIPPHYPAWGHRPPNFEFLRRPAPHPTEVQLGDIPECFNYCSRFDPSTVLAILGSEEPWARALDHKFYEGSVAGYYPIFTAQAWRSGITSYPFKRQKLTGVLEKYSNYRTLSLGENDWCLKINPDPTYEWMTYLNVPEGADVHRSKSTGEILVEGELTPDETLRPDEFPMFPWLPITDYSTFRSSPLVGHRVSLYGVYCLDCGHGCRPEIHPFDAIWWEEWERWDWEDWDKKWYFGVFQDDSNRFDEDWSKFPILDASWSMPPRAITFYFPFHMELPEERQVSVTAIIHSPQLSCYHNNNNNVRTVAVFGPDEEEDQKHLRVVRGSGEDVLINVEERTDALQNVAIENLCRCDNTLYGCIRVSVAVGKGGYYLGDIELHQREGPKTRAAPGNGEGQLAPKLEVFTEPVQFVGREIHANQPWDHYRAWIEVKTFGPAQISPPDQLMVTMPDAGVNIPFHFGNTTYSTSVHRQQGKYVVGPRQPVQPEQPVEERMGEWAMRVVAGTYEKYQVPVEGEVLSGRVPTRWRIPIGLYINPNVMANTSYPSRFCFTVNFQNQEQPVGGEFFISESKVPYVSFRVLDIHEPRSVVENGRKSLEFPISVEVVPGNLFAKVAPWSWQRFEAEQDRGTAIPGKDNRIQFTTRLGDVDVQIRAETQDADGVIASGQMDIPGVWLYSDIVVVEQPEEIAEIPTLAERLKHKTANVSLASLVPALPSEPVQPVQPVKRLKPDLVIKPTSLERTTPTETRNIVVIRALAGYFPFRDGQIYAEEECELSDRLNKILYGSDGEPSRDTRLRVFGSDQPLKFEWELSVRDLEGNAIPVKVSTKPLEEAIASLEGSQFEQTALLLYHDSAFSKDTAILVLPFGTPYMIDGNMTVRDPFGQTFTRQIKAYNYRITNGGETIQRATGLSVDMINRFLHEAQRELGVDPKLTTHINPWPEQLGYAAMMEILRDELGYVGTKSISPEEFQHLLRLIQEVYSRSTPSQQATLFGV